MAKTIPADEKVFMVSKTTNTTYSGSAALKAMNEWYTMDDVSNTVRPYKVFTALLTQSGGDDPDSTEAGPVTKGVTYLIDGADGTDDFSNVGGPAAGTGNGKYFIAINNNVPNSYGGADLIYNTGAPVATVLENTIGNVWFTYVETGNYRVNSLNLFINEKTIFIATPSGYNDFNILNTTLDLTSYLSISTYDATTTLQNNLLNRTPIEIRVYS